MIKIEDYILFPLAKRQAHLKLDEPCIERNTQSYHLKGLLAHILDTTAPGRKIFVCHACHNGKCSNPYHIYWGTPTENNLDAVRIGRRRNPWEYIVDKLGIDEAKRLARKRSLNNVRNTAAKLLREQKKLEKEQKQLSYTDARKVSRKNSQFGTCWVKKDEKEEKIKKEQLQEFISKGWEKGRITKYSPVSDQYQ